MSATKIHVFFLTDLRRSLLKTVDAETWLIFLTPLASSSPGVAYFAARSASRSDSEVLLSSESESESEPEPASVP